MDEEKAESESMLLSPQEKEANEYFSKEKEDDNDSMLLSPHPRPRTVTCISAPDDSSPSTRQRSVTSPYSSRPRSKSIRNQVDRDHHSDIFFMVDVWWKFMCLGPITKINLWTFW